MNVYDDSHSGQEEMMGELVDTGVLLFLIYLLAVIGVIILFGAIGLCFIGWLIKLVLLVLGG